MKYKSSIVLLLGACSAAHQILDWMFKYPETFFWPVFGDMFLAVPVSQGFSGEGGEAVRQGMTLLLGLKAYFFKPYIFIPEIIGITIMGWIFYRLAASREVIDFLRYGRL